MVLIVAVPDARDTVPSAVMLSPDPIFTIPALCCDAIIGNPVFVYEATVFTCAKTCIQKNKAGKRNSCFIIFLM